MTVGIIYAALAVAALTLALSAWLIWKGKLQLRNPIRAFAVLVVSVIATYLMWFGYVLTETLSSPLWCARALNAEKTAPGASLDGLTACVDLLKVQLDSLALNSHINLGGLVACLVVLIVIVVAGAKLDAAISKGVLNFHLSQEAVARQAAAAGAEAVASAADSKADEIRNDATQTKPTEKREGRFTPPPGEEL